MTVQQKSYTTAEFLEFAALPEYQRKRLELIDGEIVEMPPSSKRNTILAGVIIMYLNLFVREHDLGYVTVPDGGFELSPHNTFQPDAAFIAKARVTTLHGVTFSGAPDLAVEVVSPSEGTRAPFEKARRYLKAGGNMVWNLYPDDQIIDVCTLATNGEDLVIKTVGIDGTLDGGDVLPGFTLPVKEIFRGLDQP